jgi:hypothetical protein
MDMLVQHPDLFAATSYAVQSSVPRAVFKIFVTSLKTQTKISVTKGNAASLSLLAKEFCLAELVAECAAFSAPVDPISTLTDRVLKLELQMSSLSNPTGKIGEEIECQERGLERLYQEVERQRESFSRKVGRLVSWIDQLGSEFEGLRGEVKAVRDSAGGEIGKLKREAEGVAKSVSGLKTLKREFDARETCLAKPAPGLYWNGSLAACSPTTTSMKAL